MGVYLNPGNEAFRQALRSEIYVDKSGLIAYTNQVMETERKNLCVSRPRRFGKSMAANMLCAYYGRGCDSELLFADLQIAGEPSFREHLNRHNVLLLNIQQFIRGAGTPDNFVNYLEHKVLEEVREAYGSLVGETEKHLSAALASVYAKSRDAEEGFLFIIDEWDCVFREMKADENVQRAYLDFLRDLLKDRTYVKLAYMTGILPIKKYGTHSALNIFDEFSMTDPGRLASYVGFTEEEVQGLCEAYHMDFEEAKHWYDGYLFEQDMHIYNPKSIVDAMYNRKFRSYWTRTETYEALRLYMDMNFDGLKDSVIFMVGGGHCRINPEKFQNDMTSFESRDDVLTLLVHLGYLAFDETEREVFIPNMEIAGEFRNAIDGSKGWKQLAEALERSENLLEATLNGEEETVAEAIDAAHMEEVSVLSYHDENSLSCVIALAYFSARKDYLLIREFPSGKGFADIVFLPRKKVSRPALVVELKWNRTAEGAIRQVKDREYVKALEGYTGDILLVGINYDKRRKKHRCTIEKYNDRRYEGSGVWR